MPDGRCTNRDARLLNPSLFPEVISGRQLPNDWLGQPLVDFRIQQRHALIYLLGTAWWVVCIQFLVEKKEFDEVYILNKTLVYLEQFYKSVVFGGRFCRLPRQDSEKLSLLHLSLGEWHSKCRTAASSG